jgi:hypothetical protein
VTVTDCRTAARAIRPPEWRNLPSFTNIVSAPALTVDTASRFVRG